MRRAALSLTLFAVLAVVLTGCVASSKRTYTVTEKPVADGGRASSGKKLESLERSLAIAMEKLEKARRDHHTAGLSAKSKIVKAEHDLRASREKLDTFMKHGMPTRIARAKLSLKGAEDSLADSVEELQQLEMMYKDHEIADKTKEIVIRRAKRRHERSSARLEIQRSEFEVLKGVTLMMEKRKLQNDVAAKEMALELARRNVESEIQGKQIAIMSAESEVAKLKADIEAKEKK